MPKRTAIARNSVRRSGDTGGTGGGTVTNVTASGGLISTGGATPNISPDTNASLTFNFDSISAVGTMLSAFDTTGFHPGTLAYVGNDTFPDQNSVHDYYTLVYGENLPAPQAYGNGFVNSPTFGVDGAQWRRLKTPNKQAYEKLFWAVDPENLSGVASDENTGWGTSEAAADAHPLLSMVELNSRLTGYDGDNAITVHLMSSFTGTNAGSFQTLGLGAAGTTNYLIFHGDRVLADGGAGGLVVTAVDLIDPAGNGRRQVTIGGLGSAPQYLGMMIQTTDGLKTAFIYDSTDTQADVLSISQPRNSDPLTGDVGVVVDFAPGDVVNIYDLTRLCDWPFAPHVPFPVVGWVRFDTEGSGHFPFGDTGASNTAIIQCMLGDFQKPDLTSFVLQSAGTNCNISTCQMVGQHANRFYGGSYNLWSIAVLVSGDGPLCSGTSFTIQGEMTLARALGGGQGWRQILDEPTTFLIPGDGSSAIACWNMNNIAFNLWQQQHACSGNFINRPGVGGVNTFAWYGLGNLSMLSLGPGSKSQLPYSTHLTVDTGGVAPISIDLQSPATTPVYQFADVPINTLSGATLAG